MRAPILIALVGFVVLGLRWSGHLDESLDLWLTTIGCTLVTFASFLMIRGTTRTR